MRRLTWSKVVILLLVGIFLNVVYIAYLAFYPFRSIKVNVNPAKVITKTVQAGAPLIYELDYCRYTDVPAQFVRTLRGPTLITLNVGFGQGAMGCQTIRVNNTVIPDYALPGKYHLEVTSCYKVSPLQNRCINFRTEDFMVTAEERL